MNAPPKPSSRSLPSVIVDGAPCRIVRTGAYSAGCVMCLVEGTDGVRRRALIEAEAVESALRRPAGFYRWNRSLQGAFKRGERAALAGESANNCPYSDARKANGQLTWSRAFRSAWRDGFQWAQPTRVANT